MKLSSLTFVLVAFIFLGCSTSPSISESSIDAVPAVVKEVKKEPKKIVTTVYYPVAVVSYFGDGVKDEYTVYSYNEDGSTLLKEELFNNKDILQQSIAYETGKKSLYDASGTLVSYELIVLDADKNVLNKEKYDNKDNLISVSEYEYKNGMKISWKIFNGSNSLLSTTLYKYTDDILTRIDSLSPGGEMEEYFELLYKNNGLLLENVHYNVEGKVQDSRSFEYKDTFLVMELIKRKNSSVLRKIMYLNDQYGNPVETVFMDAGDNVQERLITDYESREEITYEN
ncbi:MAG: hypothetical protein PF693_17530 [Spirochaetia bacterium]|jgi:hypothetical protein|nr:hypothetical protein [Spirochaetia bacterium]